MGLYTAKRRHAGLWDPAGCSGVPQEPHSPENVRACRLGSRAPGACRSPRCTNRAGSRDPASSAGSADSSRAVRRPCVDELTKRRTRSPDSRRTRGASASSVRCTDRTPQRDRRLLAPVRPQAAQSWKETCQEARCPARHPYRTLGESHRPDAETAGFRNCRPALRFGS